MTEQMSKKRIKNKLLILLVMLTFSVLLMLVKNAMLDQIICIMIVDIVFYAILSFLLENERISGRISSNKTTDFRRIQNAVVLASATAFLCCFCPEFIRPILLLPIILIIFTSEWIALCLALYFLITMAIVCEINTMELSGYLMLVLVCTMLLLTWDGCKKKSYIAILFSLQIVIPALFYYLYNNEASFFVFAINIAIGASIAIFLYYYMDRFLYIREVEIEDILQDMLEPEYSIAKELKHFSKQEYEHARHVSALAKSCAALVGADELVCAAAGMYYRIGIIKGDQIAENGYKFAVEKCFPEAVCNIIYEYQGMQKRPSTPESAIVQMVDGVCRKMELMKVQKNMTDWNQDMAIYRIVNDFSVMGMYDQSGLSMNKFLKIRDYLVKEEFVS